MDIGHRSPSTNDLRARIIEPSGGDPCGYRLGSPHAPVEGVSFGCWKPGYLYPALGLWQLGIDDIRIGTW